MDPDFRLNDREYLSEAHCKLRHKERLSEIRKYCICGYHPAVAL